MKIIHKQVLGWGVNENHTVKLPNNSRIVHFDVQDGHFVIWYELTKGNEQYLVDRTFRIFGAGWNIPGTFLYHQTVVIQNTDKATNATEFVWHLYELTL